MRIFLILLFFAILISMVAATVIASLDRGIFVAGRDLIGDAWFRATLCDAYFGFITFYVWVAYKERRLLRQAGWFVAIMLLGNIAMSIYVLLQLVRMSPNDRLESLLLRRP
jgi:hypothetical protein